MAVVHVYTPKTRPNHRVEFLVVWLDRTAATAATEATAAATAAVAFTAMVPAAAAAVRCGASTVRRVHSWPQSKAIHGNSRRFTPTQPPSEQNPLLGD